MSDWESMADEAAIGEATLEGARRQRERDQKLLAAVDEAKDVQIQAAYAQGVGDERARLLAAFTEIHKGEQGSDLIESTIAEWHYDHEGMARGSVHRHGSFSDSLAFTHCICYGAAWKMLEAFADRIAEIGTP